jgi:ATP-binding cassette subfamily B protein
MHPLRRLFTYARHYRADVAVASVYSFLNKLFDVLPEVLIGVAVDVVVNQKASFLARVGVYDRFVPTFRRARCAPNWNSTA